MKFACTQENLAQGLSVVSHVTGKNVNLPVLGNVLLKTEQGGLRLSATNLEMAVNCLIRGKVEREGEYSVPAKLLLDYISLLPSGKVELELNDEGLRVVSDDKETVMKGMPASEFPLLPKLAKGEGFRVSAEDVKRAVQHVAFAASTSESRPEITGVACFFEDESGARRLRLAATDSYRLAERAVALPGGPASAQRAIVPTRSLLEIARVVSSYHDDMSTDADVVWTFTDNQLVVSYGTAELITRLIEGSFPPYEDIIPKQFATEAVLPRTELQKAVRAASLFSRQGLFDVRLTLDPAAGTCSVASADQGTGRTKTAVKGAITGKENAVTLNFRYVSDGLGAISTETVRVCVVDEGNPVLLLPEGEGEKYRYLVMPIRQ